MNTLKEELIAETDKMHAECNVGCSLSSFEIEELGKRFDRVRAETVNDERARIYAELKRMSRIYETMDTVSALQWLKAQNPLSPDDNQTTK
jgi:L-arabinose isomerase